MVTLHPSIGNWGFPCRSHYLIRRNKVVWAGSMTPVEISLVRKRDQADKDAYTAEVNRMKGYAPVPGSAIHRASDVVGAAIRQLWSALSRWWR